MARPKKKIEEEVIVTETSNEDVAQAIKDLETIIDSVEDSKQEAIAQAIAIEESKPVAEVWNTEEWNVNEISLLQWYANTWTVKVINSEKKFPQLYIWGSYPSDVFKNTVKQFILNFIWEWKYTIELFQLNGSRIKFNINTN